MTDFSTDGLLMAPPRLQQVARCQRRTADGQLVAAANRKAEEAKTEKVETEEVETIGKKGAEVEPLDVKAVDILQQETSGKMTANADVE